MDEYDAMFQPDPVVNNADLFGFIKSTIEDCNATTGRMLNDVCGTVDALRLHASNVVRGLAEIKAVADEALTRSQTLENEVARLEDRIRTLQASHVDLARECREAHAALRCFTLDSVTY